MEKQVQVSKEGYFVRACYGIMRFLGSVTRSLCEGFYFIAPFMKAEETELAAIDEPVPLQERIAKETSSFTDAQVNSGYADMEVSLAHPVRVTTQPVKEILQPVKAITQELKTTKKPVEKARDIATFFSDTEFTGNLERLKAEVYVKDFQSGPKHTRIKALQQLKKLSQPAAIGILKNLLKSRQDPAEIIEILSTLSSLNVEDKLEKRIFTDFFKDPNPFLRQVALRAVAKYRDEESFSILYSCLEDRDAEVRRQALNCLSWFFGDRCASAALKLLHDIDNHVRKSAILVCGSLKLQQAIPVLITFLTDEDQEIQKNAAESLRKLTGQNFGFRITGTQRSKDAAVEHWHFWWHNNQGTSKR